MIDRRLSSSIRVPFFNQPATTTTTPAQLAIKYDALLVPVFLKRNEKTNFEIFIEEPLVINKIDHHDRNIYNITESMNKKIEEFIKRDPAAPAMVTRQMEIKILILKINSGSILASNQFTPKCKCGPVALPVEPTFPITCPFSKLIDSLKSHLNERRLSKLHVHDSP
jgi:hypothetical protein